MATRLFCDTTIAMAASPDGALLASVDRAHRLGFGRGWRIILHDAATGRAARVIPLADTPAHVGENILAFSPDGTTLALAWRRPLARLWDVASGEELAPLPGGMGDVHAAAFSPDGKTLALGQDLTARGVWLADLPSRTCREPLPGHAAALAFSPDGKTLAAAGDDAVLRLFDVQGGRLLAAYGWHQGDVRALAFSPDGQWIASGARDSRVKLWPVQGLLPGRQ
jgi:WD40 repeat protein